MENNKFLELVGEHFRVHKSEEYVELETWTTGGVNMFVTVQNESDKSYFEQFEEYVSEFDVDDQIDIHREDSRYKSAFTIRQSVNDFEGYENWLKSILSKLEEAQ